VALTAEKIEKLRRCGDKEADGLVEEIRRTVESRDSKAQAIDGLKRLFEALTLRWMPSSKASVPSEILDFGLGETRNRLKDFLEAKGALPGLQASDWQRIQDAQALFEKFHLTALVTLGCASLPASYAQPGIAAALNRGGRFGLQVRARVRETAGFLAAVMRPGSLEQGEAGLMWIRKVRLMHALMRAFIRLVPADNPSRTGNALAEFLLELDWSEFQRKELRLEGERQQTPINQVELAFVLLTFSWLVVEGWKLLGVHPEAREREAYIFTWAKIGRELGIDDSELLPETETAARALFKQIEREGQGTEFGRLLAATLCVLLADLQRKAIESFPLPRALSWAQPWVKPFVNSPVGKASIHSIPRLMIRKLIGLDTARALWVGRPPLLHAIGGRLLLSLVNLSDLQWSDLPPLRLGGKGRERRVYTMLARKMNDRLKFRYVSLSPSDSPSGASPQSSRRAS
jgi:hypothetical protein